MAVLYLLLAGVAIAQAPDRASLRGQVVDENGNALRGAKVAVANTATGLTRQAQTDGGGRFALVDLPMTGQYRVRVSMAGFAAKEIGALWLRSGRTAMALVTMSPEASRSEVTVYGTAAGIPSDSPQLGFHLDAAAVNHTPILSRNLTALPLLDSAARLSRTAGDMFLNNTLFVVNGSGRRQTDFVVDGSRSNDAWGRQTIFANIPLPAIQEISVLTSSFSSQYGGSAGAVVNLVTKSGTNQSHGEFDGLFRPTGIEARDPVSCCRTADQLGQIAGAISGPLVKNRTFYIASGEIDDRNRDSSITSPLAPGVFAGRFRQALFLAKLDHQINNDNTLTAHADLDLFYDTNPSDTVGGLNLPSAARTFHRRTYTAGLSETAVVNPRLVNEARVDFMLGSPITQFTPAEPSTQFIYPGLATVGQSQSALLSNRQLEGADIIALTHGRQIVKLGTEALYSSSGGNSQEFGGPFAQGQFVVKPGIDVPVSALTLADVQQFTQGFGNASYNVREWEWAAFAEDDLKLRSDLTLDLGLRYDLQTFTDGRHNFSPRVGLAYDLLGDSRTVLRASYGIYTSNLQTDMAASWLLGGPTGFFNFSVQPGQLGFPNSLAPLASLPAGAALPPRDITVRPGERGYLSPFFDVSALPAYPNQLLNPYTQLTTAGVEHEWPGQWFLSVDYVHQLTVKIPRPVDLNAPNALIRTQPGETRPAAVANLTRPIASGPNGYRQIVTYINEGDANYDGLQINLKRHFNRFSLLASYTYSHSIDTVEWDAPNENPNDFNQLGKYERGNSLLDQRHRAVFSGWWQLPYGFDAGGVASLGSGMPFNITTGADNNGDGSRSDRPVIHGAVVGRDTGRGTPVYDVSPFVEKVFNLKERARVTLRAEAFNVFNHPNIIGRNGIYGNAADGVRLPGFGQPLGGISNVDPGREFQFMVKMEF
ncbi:MAG: TonB-dependent receptor [Terriglobia bacterium]